MKLSKPLAVAAVSLAIAGCSGQIIHDSKGVEPTFSFPVTNNDTPYTRCLAELSRIPGNNRPVISVGEVADKTGQIDRTTNGAVMSQGVTEMVMSALFKSGKARQVERFDLRIPLAEARMVEQGMIVRGPRATPAPLPASDFVLLGALTELNYNIVSGGAGLWISGVGAGVRTVVINVGLDLRVVNAHTFDVGFVSSLQKQIYGFEVEANIFRFFGTQLVEFDAGGIKNEPLQLGVRSVVEMAVYQIMTEYLGLPSTPECALERTTFMDAYLENRKER